MRPGPVAAGHRPAHPRVTSRSTSAARARPRPRRTSGPPRTCARELGERWGTGFALVSLATLAAWRGEFAAAVALHTEALTLAAELGAREDVVTFRTPPGRVELWLLGDRDRAAAELARAVREADRVGPARPAGHWPPTWTATWPGWTAGAAAGPTPPWPGPRS